MAELWGEPDTNQGPTFYSSRSLNCYYELSTSPPRGQNKIILAIIYQTHKGHHLLMIIYSQLLEELLSNYNKCKSNSNSILYIVQ